MNEYPILNNDEIKQHDLFWLSDDVAENVDMNFCLKPILLAQCQKMYDEGWRSKEWFASWLSEQGVEDENPPAIHPINAVIKELRLRILQGGK